MRIITSLLGISIAVTAAAVAAERDTMTPESVEATLRASDEVTASHPHTDQGPDAVDGTIDDPPTTDRIKFLPGSNVAGVPITQDSQTIEVLPDAPIDGFAFLELYNTVPGSAVYPLGYSWTWGDRIANVTTISPWAATGTTQHLVELDLTAPSEPGEYYIVFAAAPRFNVGQVFAATSANCSAVWGDGNDVGWDWSPDQFEQGRLHGSVIQFSTRGDCVNYLPGPRAANWIRVIVRPCPGDLDGDHDCDLTDFGVFAANFGCTP